MKTCLLGLAPAALAAVLAIVPATPAYAQSEPLIGLTDHNELITFESFSPGVVSGAKPVTGMDFGETLLSLDWMPQAGSLFGMSATRIYRINPKTAVATPVTDPGTFTLTGTSFDMDFIPKGARARIVSNTGQNIRVSPVAGNPVLVDAPLNYPAGDPNAGATPSIVAIAHTENYGGSISPKVFALDSNLNALMVGTNADGGTFATVKSLGFDITETSDMDVSGSTGHAFITTSDGTSTKVYQVFLRTGRTLSFGTIGGGYNVIDFAASSLPEPITWAMMLLGFGAVGSAARSNKRRSNANRGIGATPVRDPSLSAPASLRSPRG